MSMTQKTVPEICLFAPTDAMMELSQNLIAKHQLDVGLYRADITSTRTLAAELSTQGVQIFVSRRGTSRYLEQIYPNHVVTIGSPLQDYIPAMEHAAKRQGKVAFVNYRSTRNDVRTMCYLLQIDALFYTFGDSNECRDCVIQAKRDGAVLGIGGADSGRYSTEIGLEHYVVETSEQAVMDGISRARQMLQITRDEREKQMKLRVRLERYEAVINYTHDAILAVDESGKVDVLNDRAERLLKVSVENAIGKPLEAVLPNVRLGAMLSGGPKELDQLMNIKGTMVTSNRIPIVVDDQVKGVVATFQDVKSLQDSEKKIRLKLHEKGLAAKYTFDDINGSSQSLQNNISVARKYARSNSTILIHGETETGKELFAQSVHNASKRADGPFVAINCGNLPKNLLEAELFGYVDGAFTGARKGGKTGLFELAHGGTIFLDEIGEMPLETQVHLLRVLQEKEIRRLGGDNVIPVDIRVVAATNRDLPKMISDGTFRADLYYRINVLNLEIAPLRQRREDLREIGLSIMEGFLGDNRWQDYLMQVIMDRMKDYEWPGNVRELHNIIERICVLFEQGDSLQDVIRDIQSPYFAPDVHLAAEQRGRRQPRRRSKRPHPCSPMPTNGSGNIFLMHYRSIIMKLP